ncbi:divalent metal cation transporter [Bradyrhizobium sp. SSUT112]|uniref:NRAMP family divalent metal transporter n=1 Tax=Bradyrhizobium sp. SSUT112 TaxID=3040604 RepID=UPI00244A5D6A|nr:divalent metal cation transporter [Bradyrhizobium sp. SSUT112]MDH2356324.1 divalent metal cation transporter [Bradyrhizobium sp. SSUT112]
MARADAKKPDGSLLKRLGPGLITGASDDDPSGIGTYSQAGAQLGFGIGWTMLLSYPLMVAIQEISGRIGRVTGHGIAGNVCRNYPGWVIWSLDAAKLVIGGSAILYVVGFAVISVLAQIFIAYKRYVAILKWLTLVLFAYVIALAVVKVPWADALTGLFIPKIEWSGAFLTTLVAILGTTISPYLFIWQSSQEAEEQRINPNKKPLKEDTRPQERELWRIRLDTLIGMAFSNLIAIAIIITTAATLHQQGVTDVQSSAQAAAALKPIAGGLAELVFALGIIGTGLLAVPVLAGSTAYAIGEGRRWPVGLARKPRQAVAFYSVLALSVGLGVALNFTPIDPIKALYWSAVINGVLAAPVMTVLMLLVRRRDVMGKLVVEGWLYWLGWASTAAMALCIVGMAVSMLMPGSS